MAAYIRVSTDSSDQENSYETQERYFNQLIESNPEWNAVGVYSDYGISGTSRENRTGFRRLLRHCKEGKIDRIVCKSISRFARNTADFMEALDALHDSGVTILFEKENLDTADPTNDFILTTLAAIAQEESRSISGNINLGNKIRFPKGEVRNAVIYLSIESTNKKIRLLKSQVDVMQTRLELLGDEMIDAATIEEKRQLIEKLEQAVAADEESEQKLTERLDYLEEYWEELEQDYDRREKALEWMKQLPAGREGMIEFLNGMTQEH